MKQKSTPVPGLILAAVVALGASAASGHDVDHLAVKINQVATIEVANDGTEFHNVSNAGGAWGDSVHYQVTGNVTCAKKHDLEYLLLAGPASGPHAVGNPAKVKSVFGAGNLWTYWMPLSEIEPIAACNAHLAKQVAQGQAAWKLLKNGFTLTTQHSIGLAAQCSKKKDLIEIPPGPGAFPVHGGAWRVETDLRNGYIKCKGNPSVKGPRPTGPGNFAIPFAVNEVTLTANPTTQTAYSKGTVNFQGAITVSGVKGKHDVLYRFVHNNAYGPVQKITFVNQGGTAPIGLSIDVPCKASSPGGTIKPPGGGGSSGQGIGGFKPTTKPGQKNGTARIVIVQPTNGVKKSNDVFYQVNCKKTGTMAPKLPDLVVQSASLSEGKLTATIRNKGAAGAPAADLKVTLKGSGKGSTVEQLAVPALAAGTSTQVELNLSPEADSVFLHVDNPPKVKEMREDNNTYSIN